MNSISVHHLQSVGMCLVPFVGEGIRDVAQRGGNLAIYGVGSAICVGRNAFYLALLLLLVGGIYDSVVMVLIALGIISLAGYRLWDFARYVDAWRIEAEKKAMEEKQ